MAHGGTLSIPLLSGEVKASTLMSRLLTPTFFQVSRALNSRAAGGRQESWKVPLAMKLSGSGIFSVGRLFIAPSY